MTRSQHLGWLFAALIVVTLPLLWPAVPPLNDLPGHIGRYHVAAELARSPELARHWTYQPALIGNLGADLPAIALARWIGAELAAKLIVSAIPVGFVLALWALARVRSCGSPLAGFAFSLAYNQAFQLGFVNFALSSALAIAALAGWIALADRRGLRAAVFVPVAWVLWICHSAGWGMFGLIAWAADVMLARERGRSWRSAVTSATVACLPLALPMVAVIGAPRSGGGVVEWNYVAKANAVASLLRDRWRWLDVASAGMIVAIGWTALRRTDWRVDPVLGASAAILFAAFVVLPRTALDGAYVDMRLLAPALAILLTSVTITSPQGAGRWILAGAVFLAVRMAATTASFLLYDATYTQVAEAIRHLPRGASVLVLVNEPCSSEWTSERLGHIGGLATARRDVFENGQWTIPGQQLLGTRDPDPRYRADPSQLVYPSWCEYRPTILGDALAEFDRGRFSHVWLIGFDRVTVPGELRSIFHNDQSTLYAVSRR